MEHISVFYYRTFLPLLLVTFNHYIIIFLFLLWYLIFRRRRKLWCYQCRRWWRKLRRKYLWHIYLQYKWCHLWCVLQLINYNFKINHRAIYCHRFILLDIFFLSYDMFIVTSTLEVLEPLTYFAVYTCDSISGGVSVIGTCFIFLWTRLTLFIVS